MMYSLPEKTGLVATVSGVEGGLASSLNPQLGQNLLSFGISLLHEGQFTAKQLCANVVLPIICVAPLLRHTTANV